MATPRGDGGPAGKHLFGPVTTKLCVLAISGAGVGKLFDFGDFVPVNSKKCEAGMGHRPFGKRRPSERKLMTGAPFGRAGGKPQRGCTSSTPSSRRRKTGGVSVGQISSRGSRLGTAVGNTTGARIWLNAARYSL
jgi:hypothetical protein